ncbi:MAG: relaxase/mobilization nuclease, partial [Cyclobacteriaceae bacterium]
DDFNLIKAEEQKPNTLKPLYIEKAQYGKGETKATIESIVEQVIKSYKYTSLPELNAILSQYNVTASRGEPGSHQFFENGGLVYSITDDTGQKIGVPVKASSLKAKPTLKNLQKRFARNKELRKRDTPRLESTIEQILNEDQLHTKESLQQALKKKGVAAIFRTNAEGRTYGITFVDNVTRAAFKGSDLGKEYSANALLNRMDGKPVIQSNGILTRSSENSYKMTPRRWKTPDLLIIRDLLSSLTNGYSEEDIAYGFRKRKSKKL